MGQTKAVRVKQIETWVTKDRISRYRGILRLYARDKKLQQTQAVKLKSIVSKKVTFLKEDVKTHREITNDLIENSKRRLLSILSDHREFYLAFNHLLPCEIYAAVYQDNYMKRRLLDKLCYERKRKLKQAIKLQLERSGLLSDYEEQCENDLPKCEQQQLQAKLQQYVVKHNAAKTVHSTYCSMLDILKKDTVFFDTLLNVLKEDQSSQCKVILKVITMGQLATENLDDIRQKYKRMTRIVLKNMKVREHMLSDVRCQVEDLWAYAQSLIRVESDAVLLKKDVETASDKILENQLVNLEDICGKVKETLLVNSYFELLSRLEDQFKQKTNLLARLSTNIKNRDSLSNKKNQALQLLETLEHSAKTTVEQYKVNEHDILEQIEIERIREKNLKELKETHGKLFTNIRGALQGMNTVLACVKIGKISKKLPKEGNKRASIMHELNDVDEIIEVEADILVLLAKVSRKINILFGMSNFDLEKDKNDKARDLYQSYVSHCNSNLMFKILEEEPIGLFVEHELIDVTVPTRTEVKLHSRQIVEAHLKPE